MNESEIFNDTERSLNWIKWQKTVEMKRDCIIIFIALMAATVLASIPTRYYVGKIEVPESFWNQMPDSIDYISSEFNYDTLIVKNRELPFTHYIDTVSIPGNYVLSMRPQEVVAELEHAFSVVNRNHREKSLLVSVGELAPQIQLLRYNDKSFSDNMIIPGHCYLLSFWATWCGNCLQELQPEYIPSIAERFSDDVSFHFIPVCIDATTDDLHDFFSGQSGGKWEYLSEITYLDTDRKANEKYGESGVLPLNVIIGKDGKILYIHSGVINDEKGLSALYEVIKSGL